MSTAATSNLLYRLSETPEGTRLAFTHTVVDFDATAVK